VHVETTSDPVSAAIVAAVAEVLGVGTDEVTPDATLRDDLGVESIDLLDIVFRLERALSVSISAAGELMSLVTVTDLADLVQQRLDAATVAA
jgi:acyl carrier protein